jgi:hypothetical protein
MVFAAPPNIGFEDRKNGTGFWPFHPSQISAEAERRQASHILTS